MTSIVKPAKTPHRDDRRATPADMAADLEAYRVAEAKRQGRNYRWPCPDPTCPHCNALEGADSAA